MRLRFQHLFQFTVVFGCCFAIAFVSLGAPPKSAEHEQCPDEDLVAVFEEVLGSIWFRSCEDRDYSALTTDELISLMRSTGKEDDASLAASLSQWSILEVRRNGCGVSLKEILDLHKPWREYWYSTFANSCDY